MTISSEMPSRSQGVADTEGRNPGGILQEQVTGQLCRDADSSCQEAYSQAVSASSISATPRAIGRAETPAVPDRQEQQAARQGEEDQDRQERESRHGSTIQATYPSTVATPPARAIKRCCHPARAPSGRQFGQPGRETRQAVQGSVDCGLVYPLPEETRQPDKWPDEDQAVEIVQHPARLQEADMKGRLAAFGRQRGRAAVTGIARPGQAETDDTGGGGHDLQGDFSHGRGMRRRGKSADCSEKAGQQAVAAKVGRQVEYTAQQTETWPEGSG